MLTLRDRPGTKRQNVADQIARSSAVALERPALGAGIRREEIKRPLPPLMPEPKRVEHSEGGHH